MTILSTSATASNGPSITDPEWSDLDTRAVDTARVLALDAVEAAGNGHPGTAMALAPAAYLLFQRFMRHDPANPKWIGRDRFVLSCGHSSLTLYIQLYLSGYGLELDEIRRFRTWGGLPGHPEYGHNAGIEMTTGPLGQGLATAVGMAMANRFTRNLLDPGAEAGTSPFDHTVWVLASDGDLQEGITAEASSLAGHQALSNLIVVWDDNRISIEGDTAVAFSEDVMARYAAYGWHTDAVEMNADGSVDTAGLARALTAAQAVTDRPSIIRLRSVIAWPAPAAQNTAKSHGSALGAEEAAATKSVLGFNPEESFVVAEEVLAHARAVGERGARAHASWSADVDAWRAANPDKSDLLDRLITGDLPEGWDDNLPSFEAGASVATRKASEAALNAIAAKVPELWGGSADLGDSNLTIIKGSGSFLPASSTMPNADPGGRVIHFGIREHAMGAIINGIALDGLTRPFAGTFFVFTDYMRAAVRLGALMQTPVIHVWTHDSIGVGEDGPTHQPIEHLWAMRAIPGLAVVRPADANEAVHAWAEALRRRSSIGLILSRQNLPVLERSADASANLVSRGAYVLADATSGTPDVVLIATGSEVSIALAARTLLAQEGIDARVVSAPCLEWFEQQSDAYRESVLPRGIRARVSVEAGLALGWWKLLGDAGRAVSLEYYGASAAGEVLFREFGLTPQDVALAAKESIADAAER